MIRNILKATAVTVGAAFYFAVCWCLVAFAGMGGSFAAASLGADRRGAAFGAAVAGTLMVIAILCGLIAFAARSDIGTHGGG